jgi:hypothetical protein
MTTLKKITVTPTFPTPHVQAQFASKDAQIAKQETLTSDMRHGYIYPTPGKY